MRKITRFVVLVALLLGLHLVSGVSEAGEAATKGDPLIPFTTKDMAGGKVNLAEVIGKQPVLLVFWASWCPACAAEVPRVNAIYEKYGNQGLVCYGINVDKSDSVARASKFIASNKISYQVIYDEQSVITSQYGLIGVPTIIIADKSGTIIFRSNYVPDAEEINFQGLVK